MKKLLICMAVLATALISCKKDKPTPTPVPTQLRIRLISATVPSVIKVSPTAETNDIVMLQYSLTALNGDAHVSQLPIEFVCSALTEHIVDHASLKKEGETLEDAFPTGNKVLFKNIDLDLIKDKPVILTVLVSLQKSFGNYSENTTIQALVDALGIKVQDANLDAIADENIKGSAVGDTFILLSDGVVVEKISTTTTSEGSTVTTSITLKVTAFGSDQFLGKNALLGESI